MATQQELINLLDQSARRTELTANAYDEVLLSVGIQDVTLSDGKVTPNLNKRISELGDRVTSVVGKTGNVTSNDIYEALELGSASKYDVGDLPISTTQNNINKLGGVDYWREFNVPYPLNAEVRLADGTIVESAVPENATDPNTNMDSWTVKDTLVFVDSIADMLAINNPKDGTVAHVESYATGTNLGGGELVYDSTSTAVSNDVTIFGTGVGRWARPLDEIVTPYHAGAVNKTDSTVALERYLTCMTNNPTLKYLVVGDFNTIRPLNLIFTGKTIDWDLQLTAKAPMKYMFAWAATSVKHNGSLSLIGTGSVDNYLTMTVGYGLICNGVQGSTMPDLNLSKFKYSGTTLDETGLVSDIPLGGLAFRNNTMMEFKTITARDCGMSMWSGFWANLKNTTITYSNPVHTGSSGTGSQRTTITLSQMIHDDENNLGWAIINNNTYRIRSYDLVAKTISIFPWLEIDEPITGNVEIFWGSALTNIGSNGGPTKVGLVDAIRCGTGIHDAALYGCNATSITSQFCVVGHIAGTVFDSISPQSSKIIGLYTEAVYRNLITIGAGGISIENRYGAFSNAEPLLKCERVAPNNRNGDHGAFADTDGFTRVSIPGVIGNKLSPLYYKGKGNNQYNAVSTFTILSTDTVAKTYKKNSATFNLRVDMSSNRLLGQDEATISLIGTGVNQSPTGAFTFNPPTGWTVNGSTQFILSDFVKAANVLCYFEFNTKNVIVTLLNGGLPASVVTDSSGITQQAINDLGGVRFWTAKAGGYGLYNEVRLLNGDIVKSTVANNTANPDIDMTGWIATQPFKTLYDFGAVGDGVTDDSDSVQAAFNHGKIFVTDGQFVITKRIQIQNDLILFGLGGVLKPNVNSIVFFLNSGVRFVGDNLDIDGSLYPFNWNAEVGMYVFSSVFTGTPAQSFSLANSRIRNVYGAGVRVKANIVSVKNNVLIDVTGNNWTADPSGAYDNYGDGIHITGCSAGVVEANYVDNTLINTSDSYLGRGGIVSEFGANNLTIANNYVAGYDRGIHVESVYGNVIKNNGVEKCGASLLMSAAKNCTIESNTFTSNRKFTIGTFINYGNCYSYGANTGCSFLNNKLKVVGGIGYSTSYVAMLFSGGYNIKDILVEGNIIEGGFSSNGGENFYVQNNTFNADPDLRTVYFTSSVSFLNNTFKEGVQLRAIGIGGKSVIEGNKFYDVSIKNAIEVTNPASSGFVINNNRFYLKLGATNISVIGAFMGGDNIGEMSGNVIIAPNSEKRTIDLVEFAGSATLNKIYTLEPNLLINSGGELQSLKISSVYGMARNTLEFYKSGNTTAEPSDNVYYQVGSRVYLADSTNSANPSHFVATNSGYAATTAWDTSVAVAVGIIRYNANKAYRSTTAGTTGDTAPTHTSGTVSDGSVFWEYIGLKSTFKTVGQKGVSVANATGSDDASTKLNSLIASLRNAGLIQ